MALTDIVSVNITSASRGIARAAFGTCLVVGPVLVFPERSREYNLGTALLDMQADGFRTDDPIYRAVRNIATNTPKSKKVVIGRSNETLGELADPSYNQESELEVKEVEAEAGQVDRKSVV